MPPRRVAVLVVLVGGVAAAQPNRSARLKEAWCAGEAGPLLTIALREMPLADFDCRTEEDVRREQREADEFNARSPISHVDVLPWTPKLLYTVAQKYRALGDRAAAYAALERYLREVPSPRDDASAQLATLGREVASIDVIADEGAALRVDGVNVGEARGPLLVNAGAHAVAAAKPGYEPASSDVLAPAGARVPVRLDLKRSAVVAPSARGCACDAAPARLPADTGALVALFALFRRRRRSA